MTRRTHRAIALFSALVLAAAACGDDDDSGADTTEGDVAAPGTTSGDEAPATTAADAGDTATTTGDTGGADTTTGDSGTGDTTADTSTGDTGGGDGTSGSGWEVNVEDCSDPDAATAPIEGTISVGMTAPLSGGPAATAFAPTTQGMQAYFDFANENELIPGYEIQFTIEDDQYNAALTPDAVNSLLDAGVHVFAGNIGSPQNAAVMGLLNEECVPQMMALSGLPEFGVVEENPWTFGGQMVYDVEAAGYAQAISEQFGEGARVAMFTVNSEFGQVYRDSFSELADELGLEIVADQTIEAAETAPPTAQLNEIAAASPDAILAVPLGAQCPTFLAELENTKAANSGWDPAVYQTNTCGSGIILAAAGEAADGVYTAAYAALYDVLNPAQQDVPGVAQYTEYMESIGLTDNLPTMSAGWNTAEVTVEILRRAAESEDGLTRKSIIEAARDLDYHPSLAREGANAKMMGEEDGYLFEAVQIIQFDFANQIWNDVGEMNLEFESS